MNHHSKNQISSQCIVTPIVEYQNENQFPIDKLVVELGEIILEESWRKVHPSLNETATVNELANVFAQKWRGAKTICINNGSRLN